MLVRLRKGLAPDQIETVLALSRELGYAARFLDADRLLLELEGAGQPQHRSLLEDLAGVAEVLSTGDARELRSTMETVRQSLNDLLHVSDGQAVPPSPEQPLPVAALVADVRRSINQVQMSLPAKLEGERARCTALETKLAELGQQLQAAKDELRRQQARAEIAALTAASATVEEPRVVDAEDEEDEEENKVCTGMTLCKSVTATKFY